MLHAITRAISPAINECELTHIARIPINYQRAVQQQHQYEAALRSLGLEVHSLPAEPDLPDSVFVEDTALVLDECAVITRPGADSRKPEIGAIVKALTPYRQLFYIQEPGTVDGGDILRVGKTIYIGLTTRSNQSAIDQIQDHLKPYGYSVKGVSVTGCLHLKSAVTQVKADTLVVNPAWVNKSDFVGMKFIDVHPDEPNGANAVMIGEAIVYSSSYPKTQKRLEAAGLRVINVEADEVAKAEGAVTCCSLIFEVR